MVDWQSILSGVLGRGYFAKELPPCFSTQNFSRCAQDKLAFENAISFAPESAASSIHILARQRDPIRKTPIGIPNPATFYRLAKFLSQNWKAISVLFYKSPLSLSSPLLEEAGPRAVQPHLKHRDIEFFKKMLHQDCQTLLVTDIEEFYGTIRLDTLVSTPVLVRSLGNRCSELGYLIKSCQGQSDVGIPIGPDTSFLLSELVMIESDEVLAHSGTYL
jgi:hypothetical protein